MLHYLFQIIVYYLAWIGGIMLAAHGHGWLAALLIMLLSTMQLLWQIYIRKQVDGMWHLIIGLTLSATLVDSILVWSKLIVFTSNPFAPYFTAPWMIALWVSFTTLFYSTLSSLFYQFLLLGICAFLGFSLSYFIGGRLGAATFPLGNATTIYIGIIWGILLPLFMLAYQKIRRI